MSASEKQEEELFMNPGKIEEIQRKIDDKKDAKRQELLNDSYIIEKER